jgi:hypothetical protein
MTFAKNVIMRLSELDRQSKIGIIEKWKQSGLSQKDFYQQENIPAHVFYYWHKCYRDQSRNSLSRPQDAFIQLTHVDSPSGIEVCFANGCRIIFHQQVSVDFLKALTR